MEKDLAMPKIADMSSGRRFRIHQKVRVSDDPDDLGGFSSVAEREAWLIEEVLPALEEADRHPENLIDGETVRRRVLAHLRAREAAKNA